uniref:uncharacterized protein LOC122598639 n=1 Tax=Erigeron canadensis TaxID=72917 RepID=UPI001CB8B011|nr:uncharacterized protein LOC122598639 [Erigeron canadensis]
MYDTRETNPHFLPRNQRSSQPHDPNDTIIPTSQQPQRYSQPHDPSDTIIPASQQPQRYSQPHDPEGPTVPLAQLPQRFRRSPPSHLLPPMVPLSTRSEEPKNSHLPISTPISATSAPPRGLAHSRPPPPTSHRPSPPMRVPPTRKTTPLGWLLAICCVLFWIIIILGGLILLIFYLAFRPKYPKFDIASASLNAAYLDLGYLLNGDMTLLANFTNPNKKVNVEFRYMVINLYFEGTLIAARYVEPLSVSRKGYELRDVHLVSSQIPFSKTHVAHLNQQMRLGRVMFELKSFLRTTSNLGGFFRYSYWLYGRCNFVVSGPPSGILVAKHCVTKR